ncbi:hypothetical protein OS493_023379 [Desmophyllum pertusum]|uniref:Uncharacterized protein n=1 Tax=Desmophyllum pertusum TaxID=174260 RepID=A0A9W9ZZD9_9CNID|nr:hypothetical protein OS493_023379 [Desmophyllum pertusum]
MQLWGRTQSSKHARGGFAEFLETYAGENGFHENSQNGKPASRKVQSPDTSPQTGKQSKTMAYMRSVSCHHLGNEFHPRNHAEKSQSEVNLARLSPMKQFQKRENRDSLASVRSLNSYLSLCEGIDVNYVEEDDCLLNNEPGEDDETPLDFTPKLQHQQSVASDASVNSLLSLVEEDTAGLVDRPKICINEPEDSTGEQAKENQNLIENGRSSNTELAAEKKERRGGTGGQPQMKSRRLEG